MGIIEIILISFGMAMDAFAVSVCKGLAIRKITIQKAFKVGIWFGIFQFIMPIIGFYLGNTFASFMQNASKWIAFILLTGIGINMIKETKKKDSEILTEKTDFRVMLPLAVATSIDALTIGVTFSFLQVNILFSASCIGIITFILSILGVKIGNHFGSHCEKNAQIIGGAILISLGIKNLAEYFFIN